MTRWSIILILLILSSTAYAAASDSTLKHGISALPISLDPAWGTTVSDSAIKVNIYEGLTTYDATGGLVPGAAQRWEISEDGLHYTFHLRKGLRWSDGSPLTAQQFANTILRVLKRGEENQPTFSYTLLKNANEILQQQKPLSALGMEVIDQHTLRFELTRPAPYFLDILVIASMPTPGMINEALIAEELEPEHWVTNGAYRVSIYDLEKQQYQFTKNPFYHDNKHAHFETIQLQHYLKPNQAFFALLNGELDSYERYSGDQLKAIEDEKELINVIPLGITAEFLVINLNDEILKNQQVRQALSMAVDRSIITTALGYNNTQRAFSFSPIYPKINGQQLPPTWGEETIGNRRQHALKLMTEAGYGLNRRLKLEFLVNKGDNNELMAELLRRQWETIGVDLKVISHSTALHYGQYLRKGRFQVARAGWAPPYPDPLSFLELLHQQQKGNFGRWKNKAYSLEIDRLLKQPLTPEQRSATFLTLEKAIQREVPIIPIVNKLNAALLVPWLKTMNQQRADYLLWHHFRPKSDMAVK